LVGKCCDACGEPIDIWQALEVNKSILVRAGRYVDPDDLDTFLAYHESVLRYASGDCEPDLVIQLRLLRRKVHVIGWHLFYRCAATFCPVCKAEYERRRWKVKAAYPEWPEDEAGVDFEALEELPDHVTLGQAPGATTPKVLAAPFRPIVLGGPDDAPVVRGIEKDYLTPTQYQVVKVLFDAFPSRVAGDALARKSETEDPVGVIDRLSRDKDWASVLSKPGKAHGGYGIVSTPRKTQKNRETRPRKPRG